MSFLLNEHGNPTCTDGYALVPQWPMSYCPYCGAHYDTATIYFVMTEFRDSLPSSAATKCRLIATEVG